MNVPTSENRHRLLDRRDTLRMLAKASRPPPDEVPHTERQRRRVEQEQLEQIEAALGRMAAGTYGVCAVCGGAIDRLRLRVIPQARACFDCASPTVKGANDQFLRLEPALPRRGA